MQYMNGYTSRAMLHYSGAICHKAGGDFNIFLIVSKQRVSVLEHKMYA